MELNINSRASIVNNTSCLVFVVTVASDECLGSSPFGSLILRARSRSEALAWVAAVSTKRSPHCENIVFLQAHNMNSDCDQAKLDGSTSLVSPLTNRYLWLLLRCLVAALLCPLCH